MADEVLQPRSGLQKVEEVLEALLALEVELAFVSPDVFADLQSNEEIEHSRLALPGLGGEERG